MSPIWKQSFISSPTKPHANWRCCYLIHCCQKWPAWLAQYCESTEYKTPGLATQAFPTLFPYGCGDPTSPGRQRAVTLAQSFKHLIRYAEVIDDKFCWPLTQDYSPKISETSSPAHLISISFCASTSYRCSSNHWWSQRHGRTCQRRKPHAATSKVCCQSARVKPVLVPATQWTSCSPRTERSAHILLDCELSRWPEMHQLMPHSLQIPQTHGMRVHAVITNPHIADWFFKTIWLYTALVVQ